MYFFSLQFTARWSHEHQTEVFFLDLSVSVVILMFTTFCLNFIIKTVTQDSIKWHRVIAKAQIVLKCSLTISIESIMFKFYSRLSNDSN